MTGSYKLESFTQDRTKEVFRLESQVELFFERELAIYEEVGLRDGNKVIECGCGPGHLLFKLANKLPNCSYSGLEIDPFLFDVFKKKISKLKYSNILAKQGSIYSTNEDNESYDVVISRLVIEHLENPLEALKELYRILKPGGKLIIVSNDFGHHILTYPHIPELDIMYKAYCTSRIKEGGNPYIGRELPAYIQKLGVKNLNLNIVTAHNRISSDKALLKAENVNISRSLVNKGYLEQDTLDKLSNKWYDMLQNPDHAIYRQLFIVSAEKKTNENYSENQKDNWDDSILSLPNLIELDEESKKVELTKFLTKKILESMDEDAMEIDPSANLTEYYIDSLIATDIASLLKADFDISIKLSDILTKFSVNDIVEIILADNFSLNKKDESNQSLWTEGEL